jgi:hypothetical protein
LIGVEGRVEPPMNTNGHEGGETKRWRQKDKTAKGGKKMRARK